MKWVIVKTMNYMYNLHVSSRNHNCGFLIHVHRFCAYLYFMSLQLPNAYRTKQYRTDSLYPCTNCITWRNKVYPIHNTIGHGSMTTLLSSKSILLTMNWLLYHKISCLYIDNLAYSFLHKTNDFFSSFMTIYLLITFMYLLFYFWYSG